MKDEKLFPNFLGGYVFGLIMCGIATLGGHYLFTFSALELGSGMLLGGLSAVISYTVFEQ